MSDKKVSGDRAQKFAVNKVVKVIKVAVKTYKKAMKELERH
jgi:hypothetical protein